MKISKKGSYLNEKRQKIRKISTILMNFNQKSLNVNENKQKGSYLNKKGQKMRKCTTET